VWPGGQRSAGESELAAGSGGKRRIGEASPNASGPKGLPRVAILVGNISKRLKTETKFIYSFSNNSRYSKPARPSPRDAGAGHTSRMINQIMATLLPSDLVRRVKFPQAYLTCPLAWLCAALRVRVGDTAATLRAATWQTVAHSLS
jgi:hypothetical protein